ncbi:MAG: enoyl-CoA hydratase [Myxococcota bacterium]
MSAITTDIVDHVLRIGLNEPDKLNSFGLDMLTGLASAYTQLEDDPDLRCGLLYAHGEHFTTGLRLDEVGPAVAAGKTLFPANSVDPLNLFERRRSKPIVVAATGWCLTIGIELMLAADIAIASDTTRFAQMEVQRGIMAFGGATLRFAARCGTGNAMRWLLTGERFDAVEALRIGLIQEVVPPNQLLERGQELAALIAAQAPLAVQATRRSTLHAVEAGEHAALASMMDDARALMSSEDAREGVASFVERRKARFTGR